MIWNHDFILFSFSVNFRDLLQQFALFRPCVHSNTFLVAFSIK